MTLSTTASRRPAILLVALAATGALILTACGSGSGSDSADGGTTQAIKVVASTDVWGDIASQVGGDAVDVTSIISNPDQDPHSYEASTSTALAIKKAQVIIENGGGYDDFVGRMRKSTSATAPVIDAVKISGKKPDANGDLNEHVWYDFPTVDAVASKMAAEFSTLDPTLKATFAANLARFRARVDGLLTKEAAIKVKHAGEAIGITEPVPLYMTAASGLVNKTPPAFSEAVEEGDDVAPAVLQQTLDLYTHGTVKALVYNAQTSGPVTEKVLAAAKAHHVGIVPVTETLPDGDDFLKWMNANLDALASALGDQ